MSDFLRESSILFRAHLAASLRSKRLVVCALLCLAPVGFALFLTQVVPSNESVPIHIVSWMLVAQVVCPILALVFGSAVVSEEVSDRTITYLFSRPIHRSAVLFGRWSASLVLIAALLTVTVCGVVLPLNYAFPEAHGSGPPLESVAALIGTLVLGAAVYSAGFAAVGTVFKHPMILGIGYVFAYEGILVNFPLPGNLQRTTVQLYLRSLVKGTGAEMWTDERLFRVNELLSFNTAGLVLAIALAAWLTLATLVLSRRQYELTA